MVEVTKYRELKVGVFGLGKSGISALYALKAGGAKVIAWDDDEDKRNNWQQDKRLEYLALSVEPTLVDISEPAWQNLSAVILSPGVPLHFPYQHKLITSINKNCPIICDIELLYETCCRAKYIGITGTNGKSTTTSLIGHILKTNKVKVEVGGNIGIPALELQPLAAEGIYVLELSSFQIELLKNTKFDISILLNITQDHIDRHGSIENYVDVKAKIFELQRDDSIAIIGYDNPITRSIYEKLKKNGKKIIPISACQRVTGGIAVIDNVIYNDIDDTNTICYRIPNRRYLPGDHNSENIAASFAAALMSGIKEEAIIEAISTFKGLKHRLQLVEEIKNVTFVNDSKATNAEAAEKALLSYENIYWIVGGKAKEGGIRNLHQLFSRVEHAFLIGESQKEFADELQGKIDYTICNDLYTALIKSTEKAFKDNGKKTILLSPACASYDQWRNFEERGESFCNFVYSLKEEMNVTC